MEKAKFDVMQIIDFLMESVEKDEFKSIVKDKLESLWDIDNNELCNLQEGTIEYKEISNRMDLTQELIKLL
jgi:hypothetical protein